MKWHSDPGHAWLEVSKSKLVKLGIANKISPYSYQKGAKVYLEEDCDVIIFFNAYFKDLDWYKNEDFKNEVRAIESKVYKTDYAPIRNYQSYSISGVSHV
jgi:hypothetical protein